MNYLVVGDIHGNLPALEKMLKIEKGNFDCLISHGDVVNYGPWSNDCVRLLDNLPNTITLKGNHEENVLKGAYTGKNEVANAFFDYCYPRFSEFDIIKRYQESYQLKSFIVKHTINDQYIFPDTDLAEIDLESNYIIGHSHYQFNRKKGNKRIINTGSLGQNRKFLNVAEYILYDQNKNEVQLKAFRYDIDQVIDKMIQEKYPSICLQYYQNKKRK